MATLNEKKTCSERMENFRRFVWNPETKLFMGRSLINWVWISLYYLAFYVVMTGLFALSLYSLMRTINPYEPDYQDQLKSPGVTLRPDVYGDRGLQIYYNVSDNKTWEGLVTTLDTFLKAYTPAAQHLNINCTNNTYFIQDTFDGPNKTKLSCKFTSDVLQNCSGITDPTFGFPEGKPCFIVKMNRAAKKVFKRAYENKVQTWWIFFLGKTTDTETPGCLDISEGKWYLWVNELDLEEVQHYLPWPGWSPSAVPILSSTKSCFLNIQPQQFFTQIIKFLPGNGTAPRVNCTYVGEESHPLEVDYYPVNGTFNLHYFPYYGKKAQPSYSNPLVAVKFLNITRNVELKIVCRIIGAGITFDNVHDPYEGRVEFKLKIED